MRRIQSDPESEQEEAACLLGLSSHSARRTWEAERVWQPSVGREAAFVQQVRVGSAWEASVLLEPSCNH